MAPTCVPDQCLEVRTNGYNLICLLGATKYTVLTVEAAGNGWFRMR